MAQKLCERGIVLQFIHLLSAHDQEVGCQYIRL